MFLSTTSKVIIIRQKSWNKTRT